MNTSEERISILHFSDHPRLSQTIEILWNLINKYQLASHLPYLEEFHNFL